MRQISMETTIDRVIGAADASLASLYIMTSPNMPKRIYIEDIIDRVFVFIVNQLHNTIFPSLDSKKGNASLLLYIHFNSYIKYRNTFRWT